MTLPSQPQMHCHPRQETLFQALLEFTRSPLSRPFQEEVICVGSPGLGDWLSHQWASHYGILANASFTDLEAGLNPLLEQVLTHDRAEMYTQEQMIWHLLEILEQVQNHPEFGPVLSYLQQDGSVFKRIQLAQTLAELFDQYRLYSPDLLWAWEAGKAPQDWQAQLWRHLLPHFSENHPLQLHKRFLAQLNTTPQKLVLPERLGIFGPQEIPPFYLELLRELAQQLPVQVFLLTPPAHESSPLPLLLSGDKALQVLQEQLGPHIAPTTFQMTAPESTLEALQYSLSTNTIAPCARDTSIQIHSFHGPQREVAFLKDFLLTQMSSHENLSPKDILVMAPNLTPYLPHIEAVFGSGPLPFRICEQTRRQNSPVFKAFGDLLALANSRFALSSLLGLLEQEVIYRQYGLDSQDIPVCAQWLEDVGVRWGINAQHRQEHHLMPYAEHTFELGLERLLMGYALPGEGQHLFEDLLPYDHIEGNQSLALGKLLTFCEDVFQTLKPLKSQMRLPEWSSTLKRLVNTFCVTSYEFNEDRNALLNRLEQLGQYAHAKPVHLSVVRRFLSRFLSHEKLFTGFKGQVSCGSLAALRGVPARVVCLLGLNRSFPTKVPAQTLNRLHEAPQNQAPGQRSAERAMFIESLLSARSQLYLSYVGQSPKDLSESPPSVVVSELLDTLHKITGHEFSITQHPLSPISPFYFSPENPLSHDARAYSALRALQNPNPHTPFVNITSKAQPQEPILISDLVAFFHNPSRWFLQKQLGIFYKSAPDPIEDTEVFRLDALGRYALEQDLLTAQLNAEDLRRFKALLMASQALPMGEIGHFEFQESLEKVRLFAQEILKHTQGVTPQEVTCDISLNTTRITGRINHIFPAQRIVWRLSSLKAKDLLTHWIYHLALCAQPQSRLPRETLLLGFDPRDPDGMVQKRHFPFTPDASTHLASLIALFHKGHQHPLPFYCQGSWTWFQTLREEGNPHTALLETEKQWVIESGQSVFGEGTDKYILRCFQDSGFFSSEFETLAQEIYAPLMDNAA